MKSLWLIAICCMMKFSARGQDSFQQKWELGIQPVGYYHNLNINDNFLDMPKPLPFQYMPGIYVGLKEKNSIIRFRGEFFARRFPWEFIEEVRIRSSESQWKFSVGIHKSLFHKRPKLYTYGDLFYDFEKWKFEWNDDFHSGALKVLAINPGITLGLGYDLRFLKKIHAYPEIGFDWQYSLKRTYHRNLTDGVWWHNRQMIGPAINCRFTITREL